MSKPKTAGRLIVTYRCNRSCPGCCNSHDNSVREISDINELLKYDEIVITGGEPMLIVEQTINFKSKLAQMGYIGKTYLYTAYFDGCNLYHHDIINRVDGITYTIHAEANDSDILALKMLSRQDVLSNLYYSSRLIVDSRVYDRYDLSNIDLTNWDVIRKLEWKDKCEPAKHEELLYFPL